MKKIEISQISEGAFKVVLNKGLFRRRVILSPVRFAEALSVIYTYLTGKNSNITPECRNSDGETAWRIEIEEPNSI